MHYEAGYAEGYEDGLRDVSIKVASFTYAVYDRMGEPYDFVGPFATLEQAQAAAETLNAQDGEWHVTELSGYAPGNELVVYDRQNHPLSPQSCLLNLSPQRMRRKAAKRHLCPISWAWTNT